MFGQSRRVGQKTLALLAAGALAFSLSACTIGDPNDPASAQEAEAARGGGELKWDFHVEDGQEDVSPGLPATVEVENGELTSVEMVNEEGKVVEAKLAEDKQSWETTEPLGFNRQYTITATAKDADGESTTKELEYFTSTPSYTTAVSLGPLPDSEVGIGQAITFQFANAPSDRKAVEEAITIETSNDTEGAFYWVSANDLRWRPKEFWEPGTEVSVEADIYGVDMGEGLYGSDDNATNFTIGDDVRTYIDDNTKTMKVYKNGELLRSIPVSLGRDVERWATPNGTYVVGDENPSMIMDSSTFGYSVEQGGYVTPVDYATQLSYSGIYVHAAPWSEYVQGNTNTSHGCINVSYEAAKWYQDVVKRGDPVIVENTVGGTLPAWDGLGHWNMEWDEWKAGNA